MVDRLGLDKNYWIAFLAKYPFISKKYANYQILLKSSFDTGGLLKRYSKRPAKLKDLTLADWAAWYDFSGKPYVKSSKVDRLGLDKNYWIAFLAKCPFISKKYTNYQILLKSSFDTGGLLKRYSKRPAKLKDLTLADWAAWYDFSGKPYVKPSNDLHIDGLPLESCIEHHENDDDLNDDKVNENQCGKAKKRNKARIIRSVWLNKNADPEKHYRELIMLYTAWGNEETD